MNNPRYRSLTALLGILLGLLCYPITSVFNSFQSQSIGVNNQMDAAIYFALLLAIAAGVNRVVEWFKNALLTPAQTRFKFSNNLYVALTLALAFVFSLFACWRAGADFFSILPVELGIPALVGFLISAGIVTTGANGIHSVTELWTLIKALLEAQVERAENQAALLAGEPVRSQSASNPKFYVPPSQAAS